MSGTGKGEATGGGATVRTSSSLASRGKGGRPESSSKSERTESVEIVRRLRGLARELLGAEARSRAAAAHDDPLLVAPGHRRDAEVREVRASLLVEQHVRGLHVAVDDPEAVEVLERLGHVAAER